MSSFALKMDIEPNRNYSGRASSEFSLAEGQKALAFHRQLTGYKPTPLYALDALAAKVGVKKILIKDESQRFGLNAFKMLGGAYAIARLLCKEYGLAIENFSFESFRSFSAGKAQMTFATTTDGNHGRGVAWAAQQFGQKAVIYMPKGSAQERVLHILNLGAECIVTDMNYDETVRLTEQNARAKGWKIVQDTAWEGYTEIPTWIMQGYSTLAVEAAEQMREQGLKAPTHVFLQAGVGAMAAGVLGVMVDMYGSANLHAVTVEPELADCVYRSGCKGELVAVTGDMPTIMAGLACGEPSPLGWPLLKDCCTHFVSCADQVAALGMRVLGNPLANDPRLISGESGAVTAGLLAAIAHHPEKEALLKKLALNANSVVLLFNTEGDTDVRHYREVVWEGKHPMPCGCKNSK